MASIRISHFSDILCIWAYVAQIRVSELRANYPDDVIFDYRFFTVFGDVEKKMEMQWADRGGLSGYANHVQEVAAQFEHVQLHHDVWLSNTPTSSMPAHLILCAARFLDANQMSGSDGAGDYLRRLDSSIRRAFFERSVDISRTEELLAIVDQENIPVADIERLLNSGAAHATLSQDLQQATDLGIRASPTMTFNEGRQTLTGNVGYRVLEANIRELLRNPSGQRSWC